MKHLFTVLLLLLAVSLHAQELRERVDVDSLSSSTSLYSEEYSGWNYYVEFYNVSADDTLYIEHKVATKTSAGYSYNWLPLGIWKFEGTAASFDTSGTVILGGYQTSFTPNKAHRVTWRVRRNVLKMAHTVWMRVYYSPTPTRPFLGYNNMGGSGGSSSSFTVGGTIDTTGFFGAAASSIDAYQTTPGGWSGDSLRLQLVEWMRPVQPGYPDSAYAVKSLQNPIGWKRYRFTTSLVTTTNLWQKAVADSTNGIYITAVTFDNVSGYSNLEPDNRFFLEAGGVTFYDSGDTYYSGSSWWGMSTSGGFELLPVDNGSQNIDASYAYNDLCECYATNEFLFRAYNGSATRRVWVGYITLWYAKNPYVPTNSTYDAFITDH
jgi:hypothetical protein